MNLKAICFDLGNVLIFFDWKIAENRLNEIDPNLGHRTTQFLRNNRELIIQLEKGKISDEEFLIQVKNNINSKIDITTLARIYSEIFWENQVLTNLLPDLHKKYNLFLLSNTNSIHKKYGWEKFEFLKNFDKLFLSHELGYVKPEKEIYQKVIDKTKIKPNEILYIDDIKEFVEAAKECGWNAYHFTSYENLIEFLKENQIS